MNAHARPVVVVLADHDGERRRSLVAGLHAAGLANPVHAVGDAAQLLEALLRLNVLQDPATPATPAVVLLAADLPGRGGAELVSSLTSDPVLRHVPVLELAEDGESRAPGPGAHGRLRRPLEPLALFHALRALGAFALEIVAPAPGEPPAEGR